MSRLNRSLKARLYLSCREPYNTYNLGHNGCNGSRRMTLALKNATNHHPLLQHSLRFLPPILVRQLRLFGSISVDMVAAQAEETYARKAFKDILSGTAGGVAQVFAGHPLDTIKVRLQTQVPGPDGKLPFTGMRDCAAKTFKLEGLRGLYKGAASPLLGSVAHNAGVFFSYGQAKRIVGADEPGCELYRFFCAGALAACAITVVETPVDLLKIKLQAQVGKGEYSGVFDAGRKITRAYGLRGLYQGVEATIIRNVPCFGLYFLGAEFGYRLVVSPHEKPTPSQVFLGGFVGGACAGFGFWGILYPLETVKTRMQGDHIDVSRRVYSSVLDCVKKTYAEDGVATFFKGYLPSLARALPVNSAIFCAVFAAKNALNHYI